MLAVRHVGSLVVALAVAACAKFSGEDTTPDASPVPEAGPPADSAVAPPNDAGALPCKSIVPAPLFCDDFDGEEPLETKWPTKMTAGGGADVTRNEEKFVTAPRSLVASVGATNIDGTSFVETPLAGLTSRVQVDYDIVFVEYDGVSPMPVNNLVVGGTATTGLRVNIVPTSAKKVVVASRLGNMVGTEHEVVGFGDLGQWHHVTLVVERGGGPARVTVKVDGVTRVDQQSTGLPAPDLPTGSMMAGIYYTKPPNPAKVRVDNVVVRAL